MSATELIGELRAGLEGVTPGPWSWGMRYVCRMVGAHYEKLFQTPNGRTVEEGTQWETDAAHIARCSPDNIRILLDHIDTSEATLASLREENAKLRAEASKFAEMSNRDSVVALRMESERDQALKERDRLRAALITAGRNVGAGLADEVSTDFLMLVPEEIRLVAERNRASNEALRVANAALADCLDCARQDWEGNNGEIIDKTDPHWSVEARRLVASALPKQGEGR